MLLSSCGDDYCFFVGGELFVKDDSFLWRAF